MGLAFAPLHSVRPAHAGLVCDGPAQAARHAQSAILRGWGAGATAGGSATLLRTLTRPAHAGTLIAPPLAQTSLLWLCVSRVIVGLGEGLAPSAATNVMARLVPAAERSRAVSYVFGGLDLGSVIGAPPATLPKPPPL